jgi:diguanylate cyclase (GGDEF)-like protein
MKINPDANSQGSNKPVKALTKVLGQTKEVKGLVDEAAQELSSVNAVLKQELEVRQPPPGIEKALEKTETIEDKVQDAADKLSVVNAALKDEVHERHALEIQLEAVTEREEVSRYASVHDSLTGLPNRELFNDRLEHSLAQAKRHNWSLAVMFIDLDGFKKINDSYGHDAGDSVLKTIAARLTESTRDDDTVSRHGGDEFLYLLTEVKNEQDLTSIAEKLIVSIQTPCDVSIDDLTINPSISASIGISIFPKDGSTAEALIKSADQAMYRAKGSKSRYLFAQ